MPINPFYFKKFSEAAQSITYQQNIPYTGSGSYYSDALNVVQRVGSAVRRTVGTAGGGDPTKGVTIVGNPSSTMANTRRGQSYTRTMTKRKGRRTGKTMSLTKRIMNTMPAKHYKFNNATSLNKGATIYCWSPTQSVTRGTADDQRIGDTLTLCSLKWNGLFNSNVVSNSYIYRLIIGYTGEEFNAATFLTNYTTGELFQSSTVAAIKSNGIVNPKAFTLLYDQKFTISSNLAGVVDVMPVVGSINLKNQKFVYQSDGSVYGKYKNLVVVIMGDEIVGSAATDAGGASISWDFCFK